MNDLNYNEIFKNLLQASGNELSRFEQFSLLIHAIFLKNSFIYKDNKFLESDWNREYDRASFEYTFIGRDSEVKVKVELKKDPNDANNILIEINCVSSANANNTLNISSSIDLRDDMCKKIDFESLDETIKDLEKNIKEKFFKEIIKTGESQPVSNNPPNYSNINMNTNFNQPFSYGGEVDPNRYLMGNIQGGGYNPMPNPYFSTGGGAVPGGNLVGPTSDIFTGHMFPQPMSGIHPPIRYDPIGPFGTFGAPQKKSDIKKTDPYSGGNPFNGGFPGINKKPFGGGGDPFGGGFGGSPFG